MTLMVNIRLIFILLSWDDKPDTLYVYAVDMARCYDVRSGVTVTKDNATCHY